MTKLTNPQSRHSLNQADVKKGQPVLIHAAAGGVGSIAVQLVKWRGAHVVATASKQNYDLVYSLGADSVIDYLQEEFGSMVKGVDVAADCPRMNEN
ncbi:MAG: zinc-binding dehydrogenase [Candidatus Thiodiazotropha sp. (ex Dulcina madagascariensis)]|nr:zinc-binding dehydrogenase [Candidatus Thiodiazotropha sp. (ex Dulcina madagascariensis)]